MDFYASPSEPASKIDQTWFLWHMIPPNTTCLHLPNLRCQSVSWFFEFRNSLRNLYWNQWAKWKYFLSSLCPFLSPTFSWFPLSPSLKYYQQYEWRPVFYPAPQNEGGGMAVEFSFRRRGLMIWSKSSWLGKWPIKSQQRRGLFYWHCLGGWSSEVVDRVKTSRRHSVDQLETIPPLALLQTSSSKFDPRFCFCCPIHAAVLDQMTFAPCKTRQNLLSYAPGNWHSFVRFITIETPQRDCWWSPESYHLWFGRSIGWWSVR